MSGSARMDAAKAWRCGGAWHRARRRALHSLLALLALLAWTGALTLVRAAQAPHAPGSAPASQETGAGSGFALAETYFETVGAESMVGSVITALAQDAKGWLWIGTQHGLVRYDGYRFRTFSHVATDPGSLAGDYVSTLWAAPDGRLWVGTYSDGLSVFDPRTERFENSHNVPEQAGGIAGGRIWALAADAKGGVWIGAEQGLDYWPADTNKRIQYRHDKANPDSLADDKVRSLLIDRRATLWVGSATGLQRKTKDGKGFERIASDPADPASLAGQRIRTLFEAADGKLWIGTTQGVAWLDPDTLQLHALAVDPLRPDSLSNGWIKAIAQPQADRIWLASFGGGINIVAASDGRVLQRLRHDPSVASSLALDSLGALLTDSSGLLWVGTFGGGLQRHNPGQAMQLLRHSPVKPASLSHPNIRSVLELADGRIAAGSDGNGIDILERRRGLIGGHRPGPSPGALTDGTILALAQTADGALWAGTRQTGVARLAAGARAWQGYGVAQGLPSASVRSLLVARDGTLWAGTVGGLARWLPSLQRFALHTQPDGGAVRANVNSLVEDGQGRLWMGSDAGLWLIERGATGLHNIRHAPRQAASLASDDVKGMLADRQGRLWVASAKGLERLLSWDGRQAMFEHVSALAGRPGQEFGANLLEDQSGRIWSDQSLLDPKDMSMTDFSKADGFDIGMAWFGSYAQTRDGLFLLGGTQGLAVNDPARFRPWAYQPPVQATGLTIDGKAVPLGALAPALRLTPGQRSFAIQFAALDFSAPQKNLYSYRLLGYDKDWIDTDYEHRSAGYGNLWPGKYTLQVRGSNRMGAWSPHQLAVAVEILPAFWQTAWFLTLALLALGGAAYGGLRWRVARLRARAWALQAMVDARTADIVNLGKIGQDLTATLDTEQAFERIYRQVGARLDAHVFSIGVYDEAERQIAFVYLIENARRQASHVFGMDESDRLAVWCVRERRELFIANRAAQRGYVSTILSPSGGEAMETVVYLPLIVEQRVIGCLTVQSPRQNAYNADQLEFLRALASYTAIAVSNSQAHNALAVAHGDLEEASRRMKETQQQLILQEKMAGLGTLTAGVAHEINNPTNFAHVAAQNLRVDVAEFEQYVLGLFEADEAPETVAAFTKRFAKLGRSVKAIFNGTERIKIIVRDLRAFTRPGEAETNTLRLSECINSTLNLVRSSWQEKVVFVTDFTTDPEIECWPALLNQVFLNLLVNGCQAIAEKQIATDSQEPGHLHIRLALVEDQDKGTDKDMLRIVFEDDGCGIPAEAQPHVLEPFFTTKEVGSGTGLGLSISYGIVQKHGGTLSFCSTPGLGTCFTVSLPMNFASNARLLE